MFGFIQQRSGRAEEGASRLLSFDEVARPVALTLLLTLIIVLSALAVTYSAFEYRMLFNKHQRLVQQWDEYQVEWGQLLLEQSALGANSRVEQVATQKLEMISPQPEMIEIVQYER
jgi:cell division protein FtsL